MFENSGKTPKRIWCLAIINVAIILFALLVNILWVYPHESDDPISYFWTYKYSTFLSLAIIIASAGILTGDKKWRIALSVFVSLYFGEKIVDQIYVIITRYDAMVDSILKGELIATLIIFLELSLNYWVLFSKKSNQYFASKIENS